MRSLIQSHKLNSEIGICSVCSAHPLVLEAALGFDLNSNRKVLLEATSNQVNQFGGYTGMTPSDYRDFVYSIADKIGFPRERIILGGDHLGPNCWQDEASEQAMAKAKVLISEYVKAGFSKIHLDTSMACSDDPAQLDQLVIAERAATLCQVAENTATAEQKQNLCYIVGTEVPVPGGETQQINTIHVTTVASTEQTISSHYHAFEKLAISDAIQRIIAIVVQPGVEFDHSNIIHFNPNKAQALSALIKTTPLVYEAHSTDYQTKTALKELVNGHFAILKVGPATTFALREAIFGLAAIEKEIISPEQQSYIMQIIDNILLDEPKFWEKYYPPAYSKTIADIHFSLSDRIRYYWPNERINNSVQRLISNLENCQIPLGMLSQYFPIQYKKIIAGKLEKSPLAIIIDKIQDVLCDYAFACGAY